MSEHVTESGQVGREGGPWTEVVSAAPITSILAEGTAPYPIVGREPAASAHARRVGPWLAAWLVLAAMAGTAYVLVARRADRAAFERRFPIVVDDTDRDALQNHASRWSRGKPRLLAALAQFAPPALETMTGAGACPLEVDAAPDVPATDDPDAAAQARMILLPGESLDGLDILARDEIDRMIAASERGRFRTDEGRTRVLRAVKSAFVVAVITEHQVPGVDRTGAALTGSAAGVAYAFDPATGALRCAGSFQATAHEAAFETSTIRAISSSLRAID